MNWLIVLIIGVAQGSKLSYFGGYPTKAKKILQDLIPIGLTTLIWIMMNNYFLRQENALYSNVILRVNTVAKRSHCY